ncbi:MAG: flavodoxin, partial [Anaerolineae bacterium]|nr:flavodoxin [Anaerolineae bacterium]
DMKKLSFPEKLIVRGLKAQVGDFRDWEAVSSWATTMAGDLQHA